MSTTAPTSDRLGIRHLLLLTACTALALTVNRWLTRDQEMTTYGRVACVAYCLIYGYALTGLFVFLARYVRGRRTTIEHPGHVLLLLAGFGAVIDGAVEIGIQGWAAVYGPDVEGVNGFTIQYVQWVWHQAVGYALITMICAWLMNVSTWPVRWKIGFSALLATFALQSVAHWAILAVIFKRIPGTLVPFGLPNHLMLVTSVSCVAIITTALVIDRRSGVRRDWLHLCGLVVSLLLAGMEWIRYFRIYVGDLI